MAKREIPLFIVDTARQHKKGECDFICCTDQDNGFYAKVDYVEGEKEAAGCDYRISKPNNGISLRIEIQGMLGKNPRTTDIRSLLKLAMEYYTDIVQRKIDTNQPSREDCIEFLLMLIKGNRHNLLNCKPQERQTTEMSLKMLEAITRYMEDGK